VIALLMLLLLPASTVHAIDVVGVEHRGICTAAAGIASVPVEPEAALVACDLGVFAFTIDPNSPLAPNGRFPVFSLPFDLNGSEPNPPPSVFPITDDLWLERADLAWVTTSSLVTSVFELVVPYDPGTGAVRNVRFGGIDRPSVPTGRTIDGSFTRSNGVSISSFTTNLTSGALRVGSRLMVTTSNFASVGSTPVLNPGTVLLFDVVEEPGGTLTVSSADPPFVITTDPNPTALTLLPGGLVAVTNTGLLTFPPSAGSASSLDLINPVTGALVANIPLGASSPSFREIGVAPLGSVAVVVSSVSPELYAVDLRGLDAFPASPADPALQRPSCDGAGWETSGLPCLPDRVLVGRTAGADPPLVLPGAPAGTFVSQARFGAGDFILAVAFDTGRVYALAVDLEGAGSAAPLLPSRFGEVVSAELAPPLGSQDPEDVGPGPFLVLASPTGGFEGTGLVWLTAFPDGNVNRGTLTGPLPVLVSDFDADGLTDSEDLCPRTTDPQDPDTDGDDVGDACDLCPSVPNPRGFRLPHETRRDGQRDDDGDGHGNACDGDFTTSGAWVDAGDVERVIASLGRSVTSTDCPDPAGVPGHACAAYDLDEEGSVVSAGDLAAELELLGSSTPVLCPGCALPCGGPACPAP
jgi:hypothetical protein